MRPLVGVVWSLLLLLYYRVCIAFASQTAFSRRRESWERMKEAFGGTSPSFHDWLIGHLRAGRIGVRFGPPPGPHDGFGETTTLT